MKKESLVIYRKVEDDEVKGNEARGSKAGGYLPAGFASMATGIMFGLGLSISQMVDRQRVLGFLALGDGWDPTLLFVMGSVVLVTLISFRFVLAQPRPVLDIDFHLPHKTQIDKQLIAGTAIFGVGWGISGYCPGPGVSALVQGQWNPVLFLVAFAAGVFCCQQVLRKGREKSPRIANTLYKTHLPGGSS